MRQPSSQEATKFIADAEFLWHQQFELAPGVVTPGVEAIPWLVDAVGLPRDLSGMSVLDIATTNGALAFEAERRGAGRVVAVDMQEGDRFGFLATKELLGSAAKFVHCTAYQLPAVLAERFDVVIFLGVLHHLRHPLLALDAIRRVAGGVVYLDTTVSDAYDDPDRPTARFHRLDDLAGDGSNWWSPTTLALEEWCRSAGFEVETKRSIPEGQPATRCIATLRVVPGRPEYLGISREQPVDVSATRAARAASANRAAGAAAPPRVEESDGANVPLELVPPAKLRMMVAGTDNESWFVESGQRSVADLERALASVGRTLDSFTDVLEFGCGCGRMSRWLLDRLPGMNLTGIDIVPALIAWCTANLPAGHFETNPGLPPTRFTDDSFDLVINHSVFTHLDEDFQDLWLEELARIARPDGLLVLSFSGDLSFAQYEAAIAATDARLAEARRAELDEHGILFLTDDADLGFPDFYHATFHTPKYVYEHWQHWFEVLAHLPSNNLEFQDAVVVRPRPIG